MEMKDEVIYTQKLGKKYLLRRSLQKRLCKIFGPVIMTRIYYRIVNKRPLNLKDPKTFSEKICWYKIYYCPHSQEIINCSDKFAVRAYLKKKGLDSYTNVLLGKWDLPQEIVWNDLPEKFVLKCSHGCAYNIICLDKSRLDKTTAKKNLLNWLQDDFGFYNAEYHYNKSQRVIICEKYIESQQNLPTDYKIHCMNGEPKIVLICKERGKRRGGGPRLLFYHTDKTIANVGIEETEEEFDIDSELYQEMLRICETIAEDFPFVRIDFYIDGGKLKIGELTFTPAAGLLGYLSVDGDRIMGEMLDISKIMQETTI